MKTKFDIYLSGMCCVAWPLPDPTMYPLPTDERQATLLMLSGKADCTHIPLLAARRAALTWQAGSGLDLASVFSDPGGEQWRLYDLTGCDITLEGGVGGAVCPRWTPTPQPGAGEAGDWEDLGLAVDLGWFNGSLDTKWLSGDLGSLAARVAMTSGCLRASMPSEMTQGTILKASQRHFTDAIRWTVTSQPGSSSIFFQIQKGKAKYRAVISGTGRERLALYSLCLKEHAITSPLEDVLLYNAILADQITSIPEVGGTYDTVGDPKCPPALIRYTE